MADLSFMADENWMNSQVPLVEHIWVELPTGRFCTTSKVVLASWLSRGGVIVDGPLPEESTESRER